MPEIRKGAALEICRFALMIGLIMPGLTFLAALPENGRIQKSEETSVSPLDKLPPYVRQLTYFGERADWSHDGKRILFLEKTFGDVYEAEVATGIIRPITHHFFHEGYTRALYLSNGDILLSGVGAGHYDASNPGASRNEDKAELWVLKHDLSGPPIPLKEHCSEGPAVSRSRMRIAWTRLKAFYMADIISKDDTLSLANKRKILDEKDLPHTTSLETQNFRPPLERELIFTYGYQKPPEKRRRYEVMGLDVETGKVMNYSKAPDQYNEPEGIFADGNFTTVECDRHNPQGIQYIDIYKLALDGSGKMERLTHFADYPGYKASNPVISDDGRTLAFQFARQGDPAGVGRGILIFDLQKYEEMKNQR